MTGTIFDIKRFAVHDGDGIRTTVFLKGCPLRCRWCHNPEGLSAKSELAFYAHKCAACGKCAAVCDRHSIENGTHRFARSECTACGKCVASCPQEALVLYGREVSAEALLPTLLADRDFYEASGGGVTLSGGECLLQADFCAALLRALHEKGINTAVDTCGFVPRAALDAVLPYTDTFLYDIKAIDENVHRLATGRGNREILDNLRYLDALHARIEVRIPLVPDYNLGEMPAIAEFLAPLKSIVRIRVLPYHAYAASKYQSLGLANTLPPTLPADALCAEWQKRFDALVQAP